MKLFFKQAGVILEPPSQVCLWRKTLYEAIHILRLHPND
jgi:hypothetical protein